MLLRARPPAALTLNGRIGRLRLLGVPQQAAQSGTTKEGCREAAEDQESPGVRSAGLPDLCGGGGV